MGVCMVYIPSESSFNTTEVAIYPGTDEIPSNIKPKDIIPSITNKMVNEFRSSEGGEKFFAQKKML